MPINESNKTHTLFVLGTAWARLFHKKTIPTQYVQICDNDAK